jgi:glycosyltransferase involved in cell wall biosynthesis
VSGKGGGPEKTLLNNPRFLNDDYDVRLAYVRPEVDAEYDMPRRAEAVGVHLTDVPERSGTDPRTVWRLAREIARFRPHLLHAHDYKTNLLGVILARFFRIPVVTTLHGYVTRGGRLELYYLADRLALPLMDHVVSVSPDLDRQAGAVRVPASRRSMLENGIDTDDFRRGADVAAAKCRLGLRPEQAVIGAVGRLAPEKGFDVLIRATASLVAKGTDVVLLIAGTGDESDRLRVLAEELGVPDRVRLLGHVGDPRSLFEAMDVFVLSSYREGLPNVLLEAMALEVPVVATRVNGVPRLVRDGENGVLVEAGAPDQLAEAMARMLGDRATRDRLARSGRATVVEGYSFDRRMAKMRRVYERVLGRRRGPQRRVS